MKMELGVMKPYRKKKMNMSILSVRVFYFLTAIIDFSFVNEAGDAFSISHHHFSTCWLL